MATANPCGRRRPADSSPRMSESRQVGIATVAAACLPARSAHLFSTPSASEGSQSESFTE